ncbi:DUF3561 family protein [Mixta tenebrionis]|uniref:DUF3561 family protein n=1 Tax=Mixta tenebrionis TaxID=2562439 RepID=A0A506V7Z7_9GAMM|nr:MULTISPECIES: DUF3561 family protein [Mixta]QHM74402.1 Inner membrane protein YgbE [Mixta theicola]TPW41589.1 DUF3561 family protein [Mixta tenebrionis]
MHNVTPLLAGKNEHHQDDRAWSLPGGVIGFVSYWCALAIPFVMYGSNTLFFLLYTWPFFLALLPVAVLTGIAYGLLLRGQLIWTLLLTLATVVCLFWMLFSWLTGW